MNSGKAWTIDEWQEFQELLASLEELDDGGARSLRWDMIEAYQRSNWRRLRSLEFRARSMLDHKATSEVRG